MKSRSQQRTSAVLILALLLMGAIIGSGIALSTVIADSSHQSQTLNDFIAASLTADSGIERSLGVVKVGRQSSSLASTITTMTTAPNAVINGATMTGASPTAGALGWSLIRPNQAVSFDLGKSAAGTSDQYTITITGQRIDSSYTNLGGGQTTVNGQAKLDVTWLGLDASGQPFYTGKTVLPFDNLNNSIGVDLLSAAFLYDINGQRLTSNIQLGQTEGFRIQIKTIDQSDITSAQIPNATERAKVNLDIDSVKQLRVTGAQNFPSRIEITSRGRVNQSQSEKKASVLWQLPSSPAFGFVLFTEGDIIPQ